MPISQKPSRFEGFKTFSTFFSSVIIASASIFVTLTYNKQQLEISQQQAISQMEITRIKEISNLIPKLGSDNANERKFSAITLSLYGESAVPALIAILEDENTNVREASSKALSLIGEPAVAELENAFKDKRNSENLRALSIYTLGHLKTKKALWLAIDAIEDSSENPIVRKDSATALGRIKDPLSIPVLLKALHSKSNIDLVQNSIWALGEIGSIEVIDELVNMLAHPNDSIRVSTVWALAKMDNEKTREILNRVSMNDTSEKVRNEAFNAIAWMNGA